MKARNDRLSVRCVGARAPVLAFWLAVSLACARAETPAGDLPAGPIVRPGEREPSAWVIPNGRIVRPAGRQAKVGSFPLGIALTPDGKHLLVTNSGAGAQSVSVLDAKTLRQVSDAPVRTLFNGVAVSRDGRRVWVCGGGANNVQRFSLSNGALKPDGAVAMPGYPASCALSPDCRRLYVTCNLGRAVRVVDTARNAVVGQIETGALPFAIALTPEGRKAYVSNWADGTVSVLDLRRNRPMRTVKAGGLPCAVAVSPDGKRAIVANANTDSLTVIETATDHVVATVALRPYPGAPYGGIPNGLAFAPDGRVLYVTMAGLNAVAVMRFPPRPARASSLEFLPTAWYPTGIVVSKDGQTLYVVNSKGVGSGPNREGGHISRMMRGTVQALPIGNAVSQRRYTAEVAALNGYAKRVESRESRVENAEGIAEAQRRRVRNEKSGGAIQKSRGSANPQPTTLPRGIRHVVFIVRENRTYDQVLGALGYGNGDPALTIFGEEVTPNLHALARRFAIGDNMYGDGEVSVQGHQWTLGANCPDYVEKTWHALYSNRGRLGDALPGPQSYPALGYMMDHCVRHNVTCRMYGDIVRRERGGKPIPTMIDRVAPGFPGWNLAVPDVKRAQAWLEEFERGVFPQFTYIWLPNDHTAGTRAGFQSPRAMVADNDLATGQILEALSKHPAWRDTVVFLTEDDTQDGRDHVDAHRNILLVAGPRVRPGAVTSRHHSIASIYATIERLLGLPPMSQYDDLGDPISDIWQATPDLRPFAALPARVPLDEKNARDAPMARESAWLDLDEPDANTNPLLERILWRVMKGASPKPSAR